MKWSHALISSTEETLDGIYKIGISVSVASHALISSTEETLDDIYKIGISVSVAT